MTYLLTDGDEWITNVVDALALEKNGIKKTVNHIIHRKKYESVASKAHPPHRKPITCKHGRYSAKQCFGRVQFPMGNSEIRSLDIGNP